MIYIVSQSGYELCNYQLLEHEQKFSKKQFRDFVNVAKRSLLERIVREKPENSYLLAPDDVENVAEELCRLFGFRIPETIRADWEEFEMHHWIAAILAGVQGREPLSRKRIPDWTKKGGKELIQQYESYMEKLFRKEMEIFEERTRAEKEGEK